jgi:CheY-like chemotaxis protein
MDYPKRILLVDDEPLLGTMKKLQLQRYNYQVQTASSPSVAIEKALNSNDIDLILMDIDLNSNMDGTQVAEEILKHKNLPIIFFSSHSEKEIVEKTEKITSYGYVVKNSDITVVDASIKMAFKLFEALKSKAHIEDKYRKLFENLSDAFAIHKIIVNDQGNPIDYEYIDGNGAFFDRVKMEPSEILGKTAKELFPHTEQAWIDAFGRVALTGRSEAITHYSKEFDQYYEARIYCPEPGYFAALFVDLKKVGTEYLRLMSN